MYHNECNHHKILIFNRFESETPKIMNLYSSCQESNLVESIDPITRMLIYPTLLIDPTLLIYPTNKVLIDPTTE